MMFAPFRADVSRGRRHGDSPHIIEEGRRIIDESREELSLRALLLSESGGRGPTSRMMARKGDRHTVLLIGRKVKLI